MTTTSGSLSGLGISGLSSGLDTTGIISKLMAIEAQPQNQLKAQLSTLSAHRTALQSLNTQLAAIVAAATTAAAAGGLTAFTAASDSSAVTATAGGTASAGSVSFTVTQIAQAQVSVSDPMTTWPDTSSATPNITITVGSGATATTKTVTAASGSLDDVVAAINAGATGVTATKVAAGTDASGTPQYRLQFRSTDTGAAAAFSIADGTGAAVPTTTVAAAQDASLTLYAGTAAQQVVTSASNTFAELVTGVSVTVSAVTASPATVTIAPDSGKATSSASNLTGLMVAFFSTVANRSAMTPGVSGGKDTPGVFTGDTAVRTMNDAMLAAVSDPVTVAGGLVSGVSPSTIGITLTKTGTVSFDQAAFTAAMAKDPAGTTAIYQAVAGRIETAATALSDPLTGSLTTTITSEQGRESSITDDVSAWDTRLAAIQDQYQKQFNALETALNSLSSQASWLTSQISGLPTTYEKS